MSAERWNDNYRSGTLPWDTGVPDEHLVAMVDGGRVARGAAVEIGCGTGTNALWLATQGFEVTALDLAELAIARARSREGAGAVQFGVHDILAAPLPGGPYTFAYDRGCFHVFDAPEDRARFAERVAEALAPGGLWLSIVGSTEGPARDSGPPRRSLRDLAVAVEPFLELLELVDTDFAAGRHADARA